MAVATPKAPGAVEYPGSYGPAGSSEGDLLAVAIRLSALNFGWRTETGSAGEYWIYSCQITSLISVQHRPDI
jgi:hypothetical protein